ncbi:uncharacterized protein LOC110808741 [Carica papaya]|uniref:uncharacterized protein LOC110808741 n=1 Tax=Carica papaya TaxID=3649 RepID=UPI000B8C9654|nr:uncharacterized protein LOC110808741 [Carica papaya]
MKVAPKIIFLFRDPEGFGTAIAESLNPNPNSTLRRQDESFELSLEHYGIKDHKASGNILHFIDDDDIYRVSVFLLQSYKPPILVCAVNEVLAKLAGEIPSTMPTVLAPFIVESSKLKCENRSLTTNSSSLYGIQIGPERDITMAMTTKIQKPPSSLQIYSEPLSCFLQLVHILKLPTVVLIGQHSQSLSNKALQEELQVLYKIGELLASSTGLHFSKEKVIWNPIKTSKDDEAPWRALYG